jgi:hypothetical protein
VCGHPDGGLSGRMANTRSELVLREAPSPALLELIRTRFDGVSAREGDASVLILQDQDQASVRALLTLLWDAGHEVYSLNPLGSAHEGETS